MKTAQLKNFKKIALITGLVAVLSLFLSVKPAVKAQTTSNPFISEPPTQDSTLTTQPDATQNTTIADPDMISLTAIPPRLGEDGTIRGEPGEKIQVQLRLRNTSNKTVNVVTSAQDFIISEDGETPVSVDDTTSNRWSLASWLTISPTEHVIPANSTVGINVLVEVPQDALPGGHYAMVLHEPTGEVRGDEAVASAINQRVGTLIYLVVEGPINEEAYVRDFTFPEFSEYGPVPFNFVVENNSDVHITPQMSVEIFNIFNQKVETIPVTTKNIFPLTSRNFDGQWERIWGLGLYNAKLTMSYGSSGAIVVANTSFWLLPIKIIIATITIILTIFFLIIAIKRHLEHKRKVDEKRIKELEAEIEELQSEGDGEKTV